MFEVVPLAPTSTHSGVVDHLKIECNPAVLYFSIFSVCDWLGLVLVSARVRVRVRPS